MRFNPGNNVDQLMERVRRLGGGGMGGGGDGR